MPKTIAVIPACNEEEHISNIINKAKKFVDKVIVVDDGSEDKTYDVARKNADIVLQHVVNMGKGFALRTGIEAALEEGAKKVVLVDADGQHNPEEIPKLVKAAQKNDFVIGSRVFNKEMPIGARFGNRLLSFLIKIFYGMNISDSQSGFRVLNSRIYDKIRWETKHYGVETEILIRAARNKISCAEVPIKTIYHEVYKGTSFIDGIKIFFLLLKWRFIR